MIAPRTESAAPTEHQILVQRTARYLLLGDPSPQVREVWIALHGYGQLARDFARAMAPVASPERLIVVPEALSRFYLASPVRGGHAAAAVGAAWMTREDRDAEIADYVAYLDALHERIMLMIAPGSPITRVLGFSQGVATASRWLTLGRTRAEHVILWAGGVPDEIDVAALVDAPRRTRVSWVAGAKDDIVAADTLARSAARVALLGDQGECLTFDGGHRLDRETLGRLAARSP